MPDLLIRSAKLKEIPQLQLLELRSSQRFAEIGMTEIAQDPPLATDFLTTRLHQQQLVIAETKQQIVGFMVFTLLKEAIYLEQIDVEPLFARQGIGSKLIDYLADIGRHHQRNSIQLSTFKTVAWNAPYYQRLGFQALANSALSPELIAIRQQHILQGLNEDQRVFMWRNIAK